MSADEYSELKRQEKAEVFDLLSDFLQEMEVRPRCNARYVKMVAKTIGTCPEGHVGAGQKAWIFCDELVIE